MKTKPTKLPAPTISMSAFFELPEVKRLQMIQAQNPFKSEAATASRKAMRALAATYGADRFFGPDE